MNDLASELRGAAITTIAVRYEHDVVLARQRARQIALHVGIETQEQVRFATAVSELARNAFQYAGGGRVEFAIAQDGARSLLMARVRDQGEGIKALTSILQGGYVSTTGMGLGIIGARRLSDHFAVDSEPRRGTTVSIGKLIPHGRRIDEGAVAAIAGAIAREGPNSPFEELQRQNQELIAALDMLRESKADVDRLNRELEETNRGVVALYAELDDRAEQMHLLSETKSRFLSDMSHELRTPLTSIINLSRLLLARTDGELTAEQERQVTFIERSSNSLTEMVSDLLDIAKIEAGHVELRHDTFTTAELFNELRSMFRSMKTAGRVSLVFDEPSAPITLRTDEGRVSQVLRNFISNALKFTSAGEVRVAVRRDASAIRFEVRDTGIGIPPEDQERIFEDYAQVDGPIQRRLRGTGLGLPLTRKLAKLLRGSVSMSSTVGQGSTFVLLLPVDEGEHA